MRYAHISAGDGTASTVSHRGPDARVNFQLDTYIHTRGACMRACAEITRAARLAARDTIVFRLSLLARIARRISRAVPKAWRGVTSGIQVPCDKGCCVNARWSSAILVYALLELMIGDITRSFKLNQCHRLKRQDERSASISLNFIEEKLYLLLRFVCTRVSPLLWQWDFSKKINNNRIYLQDVTFSIYFKSLFFERNMHIWDKTCITIQYIITHVNLVNIYNCLNLNLKQF